MEHLVRVIYTCTCVSEVREHEILTLLKHARIGNRKSDISGMLLYPGECFLQLFEGGERMVDAVCSTLYRDKPHLRLKQLVREPIAEREFPEWTMGLVTVDPREAGQLLGNADLFKTADNAALLNAEDAKTLISIFGRRRYQSDRSGMYRAISHPTFVKYGGN